MGVVSGGSFMNISLRGFFAVALFLSVLLFSPTCPAPTDGDYASEPVPEYQNLNCNQICFVKEMMCIGERMQPHLNQYHFGTPEYSDMVSTYLDCNKVRVTCADNCHPDSLPSVR